METETTLSSAWDQHLASEFAARNAEQALATMTAEPHVNLVPLMLGARGRAELHDFYANHFLNQIPPDMEMVPVSRTVGQGLPSLAVPSGGICSLPAAMAALAAAKKAGALQ